MCIRDRKKESALFLKDYYKKTADNREENNRNENIEEIIKERYKLEHRDVYKRQT